jgi:hypothetical protein
VSSGRNAVSLAVGDGKSGRADRGGEQLGQVRRDYDQAAQRQRHQEVPEDQTAHTFREMSEPLYLSPHTVKSQALSLSRSQAIQRMQQTGLLAIKPERSRSRVLEDAIGFRGEPVPPRTG